MNYELDHNPRRRNRRNREKLQNVLAALRTLGGWADAQSLRLMADIGSTQNAWTFLKKAAAKGELQRLEVRIGDRPAVVIISLNSQPFEPAAMSLAEFLARVTAIRTAAEGLARV